MLIVLLHDQKYQKSARRTRAVLLPNLMRRARVSRASHAWQVRAAKDRAKVGGFTASLNLNYTTRANIAHEKAEQIRTRIVCTPAYKGAAGVGKVLTLTEWSYIFLFWLLAILGFLSCRGRRDGASWVWSVR